jgi:hypothetical protein
MTKAESRSETKHQRHEMSDPVLLMLGVGKQLWQPEPGDSFIERLRSEDLPPSPLETRLDAPARHSLSWRHSTK